MITKEQYQAIRQDLCKSSFYDFIREVQPTYQFNFHHLLLIKALQKLADREIQQLLVMMPPRHGKSELVSRLFPAWMLARNPQEQIIAASYSADLAGAMSRDCQRVISSATYEEVFPDTKLAEAKDAGAIRTSKRFDIVGGRGYYLSAGVGGGITGAGCTVAIICLLGIFDRVVNNCHRTKMPRRQIVAPTATARGNGIQQLSKRGLSLDASK